MEQQEPRKDYVKNLNNFLTKYVRITPDFMYELEKHSNKEYIDEVNKFKTDMEKKILIFLEFTRERSTCKEMIEILKSSGQPNAADKLSGFNASPPFMEYTYEIPLAVTPTMDPKSNGSKYFKMDGAPKGFCSIFNNVKSELENETWRFKNVFEQIGFAVDGRFDQTGQEMRDFLYNMSKDERLKTHDALIIMIISHGRNEKIICKDGTEIGMAEVVDYFSDINCPNLSEKPKMFFFNCCRTKTNEGNFMHNTTTNCNWMGKTSTLSFVTHAQKTSERMKSHGVVEIRLSQVTRELFLNPWFVETSVGTIRKSN